MPEVRWLIPVSTISFVAFLGWAFIAGRPSSFGHYATLGIKSTATTADVEDAYGRLAMKYHMPEDFLAIHAAFLVLSDEALRREYEAGRKKEEAQRKRETAEKKRNDKIARAKEKSEAAEERRMNNAARAKEKSEAAQKKLKEKVKRAAKKEARAEQKAAEKEARAEQRRQEKIDKRNREAMAAKEDADKRDWERKQELAKSKNLFEEEWRDMFVTLGLKPTATIHEVKQKYQRLVDKHHPTKNPGSDVSIKYFEEIKTAYDTILAANA